MTNPQGSIWANVHDPVGNLSAAIDPLGQQTDYTYDGLNRLAAQIRPLLPDGLCPTTRYAYDLAGNLARLTSLRGFDSVFTYDENDNLLTARAAAGGTSSYAYDEAGRLTSLDHRLAGSATPISAYAYTLDGVGNRTAVRETRAAFDGSKRVASLDHRYSYDKADRLIELSTTMGVAGAPTSGGTASYRFDPAGNRLDRGGSLHPKSVAELCRGPA